MPKSKFLLSVLPLLCFAPDTGGAGGSNPPATLEDRLSAANAKVTDLEGQIGSLTKERDDANAKATQVASQFDTLSTEATGLRDQVAKLTSDLSARDAQIATLTKASSDANENVARLSKLCAVKGIDPNAAPAADTTASGGEHVYDKWMAASGSEKQKLWRDHRAEIRVEGERRANSIRK